MHVEKVISYRAAWSMVDERYLSEIADALSALDDLYLTLANPEDNFSKLTVRDQWNALLSAKGWHVPDDNIESRIFYSMPRIGPIKSGLAVNLPMGMFDQLGKWLFQDSAIAVKQELIKLPIMFIPMRAFKTSIGNSRYTRVTFEGYLRQIERLAPLTYQYPFLIVGYSDKINKDTVECIEIEIDSYQSPAAIDRCIEFPPEYHQAGLGILNYFGTYLREQYPEENASVKIEQNGLTVRLVILTEDGRSEIVEKALHEFELIITGAEAPEDIVHNTNLILDLRNELRIAQFRLESKQDIIGMQNARIDKLLDIVSTGLSQRSSVVIDFKPVISLSNEVMVDVRGNVVDVREGIKRLLKELPCSGSVHSTLEDLRDSLTEIESIVDKKSVKKSSVMQKFKRVVDSVVEAGSEFNLAIKKAESGWVIFTDIAKKYNSLAEWCGLPIVPSTLLK